jgi:hypothetical protein
MNNFERKLAVGKMGEDAISVFLQERGYSVLPVYEKIINEGKGPQIFRLRNDDLPEGIVAPDAFVFNAETAFWAEAKTKSAFSWHRNTQKYTTGIDIRHYEHYCEVDDSSPWDVWLLFLQKGGSAKGETAPTEAGLFTQKLSKLRKCENHRSNNHGNSGMVYWARESLIRIASYHNAIITTPSPMGITNKSKES